MTNKMVSLLKTIFLNLIIGYLLITNTITGTNKNSKITINPVSLVVDMYRGITIDNSNPHQIEFYPNSSNPINFIENNNKIYFLTENDVIAEGWGTGMFSYDPNQPIDINPETYTYINPRHLFEGCTIDDFTEYCPFFITNFVIHNNLIYFIDSYGLSVYDESLPFSATNPMSIPSNVGEMDGYDISNNLIIYNEKLYFSGYTNSYHSEIYYVDLNNVSSGINLLYDIYPNVTLNEVPQNLFVYNERLYFVMSDFEQSGYELWVYDSKQSVGDSNPKMLYDINPGIESSFPNDFKIVRNKLYFSADDNVHGNELWVYDSSQSISSSNPKIVFDIDPNDHSSPSDLVEYEDRLFFTANKNDDREIWVYYLDEQINDFNPQQLVDINSSDYDSNGDVDNLTLYNNKIFFSVKTEYKNNYLEGLLWVYNPENPVNDQNPKQITVINQNIPNISDTDDSLINNFFVAKTNNKLYFTAYKDGIGKELFQYNGK